MLLLISDNIQVPGKAEYPPPDLASPRCIAVIPSSNHLVHVFWKNPDDLTAVDDLLQLASCDSESCAGAWRMISQQYIHSNGYTFPFRIGVVYGFSPKREAQKERTRNFSTVGFFGHGVTHTAAVVS